MTLHKKMFIIRSGRATVKHSTLLRSAAFFILAALSACGTYTPDKDPFSSDASTPENQGNTTQGIYETAIVNHVQCEIAQGLMQVKTNGLRLGC
jgi:hypothetical protein